MNILDSSKIPTATAPQGKLPPGSKRYVAASALQPHPNERARHDSHAAPRIKPSPCGPRGGDRNGPRATKDRLYYKQRVLLPRKACLRRMMQPFRIPAHVNPGQPFRTCQIYGPCEPSRDDRGRGAVGLPRRKSYVSKMQPACLRHAAVILT